MAKRTKLPDVSPYARPFLAADLRAAMADAGLSNSQLACLTGYTVRSVETWVAGSRPVPLLVRRVVRAVAAGAVSLNTLFCL